MVASYALVIVLAVLNAVWSVFLLPLRVGGTLVPVCLLLAGPGTVALGLAGARAVGRRAGAIAPGVLWVLLALLAGSRRDEGDLLIAGGEGSGLGTLGLVLLGVGALGAGLGYALSSDAPPPEPPGNDAAAGLVDEPRAASASPEA